MGRHSTFQESYVDQAVAVISVMGCTDVQLAAILGVSETTIYKWKLDFPHFAKAVQAAKDTFDTNNVERALLERAMGYSHPDTHISNYKGEITVTPVVKHYPPDTAAAQWWLRQRNKERWPDKIDIGVSGTININVTEDEQAL